MEYSLDGSIKTIICQYHFIHNEKKKYCIINSYIFIPNVQVMYGAYSAPFRPPIPFLSGHSFRSYPATHSVFIRPLIPELSGHL